MKTFRAIYSTEAIKNIQYDFNAKDLQAAEEFASWKFNSINGVKVVEIDPETLELLIESAKEVKQLGKENIKSINGVDFSGMYPMLELTNKHISYYSPEEQGEVYLYAPYKIELK